MFFFPSEIHLLNGNRGRAPTTATTGQSAWQPSGTASTWRSLSLRRTGSRWSSSPMTKRTSGRQRRAACWRTNVIGYRTVQSINIQTLKPTNIVTWLADPGFLNTKYSLINVSGEEYIKSLIANPELVDRLALTNDDKVNAHKFKPLKYRDKSLSV